MRLIDTMVYEEETHTYKIFGDRPIVVPSVTQLMKHTGIIPTSFEIPLHFAERGTEVHKMTEDVDDGLFSWDVASDRSKPYVHAYRLFIADHSIQIIGSEEFVFHENLFYAGRLDRHWIVDGVENITDIKTGKKTRWHIVQLAAYRAAKGMDRTIPVADLYLGEYEYLMHEWAETELKKAEALVNAMADCYWFTRPRDFEALRNLSLELGSQPPARDDFFFK